MVVAQIQEDLGRDVSWHKPLIKELVMLSLQG